ncbi:hypothetical protein N2W54_000731 [Lotmaria passim]
MLELSPMDSFSVAEGIVVDEGLKKTTAEPEPLSTESPRSIHTRATASFRAPASFNAPAQGYGQVLGFRLFICLLNLAMVLCAGFGVTLSYRRCSGTMASGDMLTSFFISSSIWLVEESCTTDTRCMLHKYLILIFAIWTLAPSVVGFFASVVHAARWAAGETTRLADKDSTMKQSCCFDLTYNHVKGEKKEKDACLSERVSETSRKLLLTKLSEGAERENARRSRCNLIGGIVVGSTFVSTISSLLTVFFMSQERVAFPPPGFNGGLLHELEVVYCGGYWLFIFSALLGCLFFVQLHCPMIYKLYFYTLPSDGLTRCITVGIGVKVYLKSASAIKA